MATPALILLVDDDRLDVELTLDAFKTAHFANPIQVCKDGQEALDYLFGRGAYTDRAKYPLPSLILLDLKMPRVDGIEVLRQAKAAPILKRIPIIILTASKEEADQVLGYDNGANSYLIKPVSIGGFLELVRDLEGYWLQLNIEPPDL